MPAHTPQSAAAPMTVIVRVAIIAVTLALFFGSSFNALLGHRDVSVLLALATPLGLSAWGFARAGYHEAAMALVCCVLIVVITLILFLGELGVHDAVITGYAGVVLVGALVLSRRSFIGITALTVFAAATVFTLERYGMTRSLVAQHSGWPQLAEFLVVLALFATIGRVAAEQLLGSLGSAQRASAGDPVTGLPNRAAFLEAAGARLQKEKGAAGCSVFVLADLDGFRRLNLMSGHRAADGVLAEATRRLALACPGQLVGRVGDDEFAVLAVGLPDERAAAELALAVHRALDFEFSGSLVRNSAGYARFPRDAHGIEALHLAAETSLASAKTQPGERFTGPADRI